MQNYATSSNTMKIMKQSSEILGTREILRHDKDLVVKNRYMSNADVGRTKNERSMMNICDGAIGFGQRVYVQNR